MNAGFLEVAQPEDINQYRGVFHRFMAYKLGRPVTFSPTGRVLVDAFPKDHVFTNAELTTIDPMHICHWFCLLAYNKESPERDDRPTKCGANTLKYHKKAISYFMPHNLPTWDDIHFTGNPTKSRSVNMLLKVIEKWELRGEGKKSSADRPYEPEEYEYVMQAVSTLPDASLLDRVRVPCMFAYQVHMIARLDEVVKLKKSWIRAHPQYDFMLLSRLPWAKNVRDKRQSPWQVTVGEDDWRLDVLLSYAKFLEIAYERGTFRSSKFVFVETGDTHKKLKERTRTTLKEKVIQTPEFKAIYARSGRAMHQDDDAAHAKVAAHSGRKYGKNRALKGGNCIEQETDWRGRWKDMAHASSVYGDTALPYPDAKVAFALCHGGPIKYKLADECGVSDLWIAENVMPNTTAVFGSKMGSILGKALLWTCFDDEAKQSIDDRLRSKIVGAYSAATENNPAVAAAGLSNPVVKKRLVLYERNGTAIIEELRIDGPAPAGNITTYQNDGVRRTQQHDAVVLNEISLLRDELRAVKQENLVAFQKMTERQRAQDRLLKRLAQFAYANKSRGANAANADATEQEPSGEDSTNNTVNPQHQISPNATLSRCPRDLWMLWEEYEHGLEGRKAAKDFNYAERGKVASTYSKRNHVWKLIRRLVNERGVHYSVAIDSIYAAYSDNPSVTSIIKAVQADASRGGHKDLR